MLFQRSELTDSIKSIVKTLQKQQPNFISALDTIKQMDLHYSILIQELTQNLQKKIHIIVTQSTHSTSTNDHE